MKVSKSPSNTTNRKNKHTFQSTALFPSQLELPKTQILTYIKTVDGNSSAQKNLSNTAKNFDALMRWIFSCIHMQVHHKRVMEPYVYESADVT